MPSSRKSSWPRDQTHISCASCIAGGFFTTEPLEKHLIIHTLILKHIKCARHFWALSESWSVVSNSLLPYGLYRPWNSPGQNTGVGSLSLLQGILPTQGSNPGLPHCRQIFYQLSHKGSQRILEWVAHPFSSGSSRLRNRTGVSCIAGRFLTSWATREALTELKDTSKHTPWHGPAHWGQAPETRRTRIL